MKVILTLLIVILYSCGKNKDSTPSYVDHLNIPDRNLNPYTDGLVLSSQTPAGLGTLLVMENGVHDFGRVQMCTWFLVANDIMMTNSHCIPDAVKNDPNLGCEHFLQGAVKTERGDVKRVCKKLIFASPLTKKILSSDDYALIQLDQSIENATIFDLSRDGVGEDDEVTIPTMNHSYSAIIYSNFTEHRCIVKSSDSFGIIASRGSTPLAVFLRKNSSDSCKIIPGNSGSPVLNKSGVVVGIVQEGLSENFDINASELGKKVTDQFGILSNFRCLPLHLTDLDMNIPPDCAEVMQNREAREELRGRVAKKNLEKKLEIINKQIAAELPSFVEFEIKETKLTPTRFTRQYNPKCIKALDTWKKKDLDRIFKRGFIFKTKEISFDINDYLFEVTTQIDYYGNLELDLNLNRDVVTKYDLKKLEDLNPKTKIPLMYNLSILGKSVNIKVEIGQCLKVPQQG